MNKGQLAIIILVSLLMSGLSPLIEAMPSAPLKAGPMTLTVHAPINIDHDGQFDVVHGVSAGTGTKNDPYIIENWSITVSSMGGIRLNYTTKYFTIRNCKITGGAYNVPGIYFYHISNGTADNNTLLTNEGAIKVEYSNWNVISNNTINNDASDGIYIQDSSNNTIMHNDVRHSGGGGLVVTAKSPNNRIFDNDLYLSYAVGVGLYQSKDNQFYGNRVYSNGDAGIDAHDDNDKIENNTIYGNKNNGINDDGSGVIANNTIYDNQQTGILIDGLADGIRIEGNVIYNETYGIYASIANHLMIMNNTIRSSPMVGLVAKNCVSSKIQHNLLEDNYIGMALGSATISTTVQDNRVFNNTNGIQVSSFSQAALYNNTMADNRYDFSIDGYELEDFNLTIATNNTVEGRPIYYLFGQKDMVVPSGAGFVGVAGCHNVTVKDQAIYNESAGILVAYGDNITVENNHNYNDYAGIEVNAAKDSRFHDNLLFKDENGIILETYAFSGNERNSIDHNMIFNCSIAGVYTRDSFGSAVGSRIHDNDIHDNSIGLWLSYSMNNIIDNNTINNNSRSGIVLAAFFDRIQDNRIYDNGNGTLISGGKGNVLS